MDPLFSFHYLTDGQSTLRRLIRQFELCPKLCFLQTGDDGCDGIKEGYCLGACEQKESAADYNERVAKATASLLSQPSFAIIDDGINGNDRSCILVWEGKFYGMGYVAADDPITDPVQLKNTVTAYHENSYIRNMVLGYAARFPDKVIHLKYQR
jgi:DNA polymerase-3 subunit epsilon